MSKFSAIHILCLVLAVILMLCVFPLPYGYYAFVRLVTSVAMGYMAYKFYQDGNKVLMITAGLICLLFQPFAKIPLEREVWAVIDALLAVALVVYVVYSHKHPSASIASTNTSSNRVTSSMGVKWNVGYDVFISYSTRDYMDAAGNILPNNIITKIQQELSNAGITYWIDKNGLSGGTVFPAEIAKQIQNAKVFLFISTVNSNNSMWTMNEIATAQTYGKKIIPFRYDNSPYSPAVMIYIAGLQYIDYTANPARALRQLVEVVRSEV